MDRFYPVIVNNMLRGKEFKCMWTGCRLTTDFPPILTVENNRRTKARIEGEDV